MTDALGGKTPAALGVMLALLAVPYASPRLARFRVVRAPWDRAIVAEPAPAPANVPVLTQGETKLEASENKATVTNALPDAPAPAPVEVKAKAGGDAPKPAEKKQVGNPQIAIEDPSGHALDAVFASMKKSKAKEPGAVTRILHYGDSVLVSDYVSGTMRRKLQADFGDAGHGFLLIAKAWDWYYHNDVIHGASEGWSSSRVTGPLARDGKYGVGGVVFTGSPGSSAWFGTSTGTTYGKKVSRFDVYFEETPGGGDVEAKLEGRTEKFSTKGDAKVSRLQSFSQADGEGKLTLRVVSGNPKLYGVALERDVPGVIYDALGANGGRAELLNGMDQAHWTEQMALRKPSLVILNYGANESEVGMTSEAAYEKTLRALVDKIKASAPGASLMIVSALDRAENVESGGMRTKPIIKKLVSSQKKVAAEAGIAFFSMYDAMGGENSMATWVRKGLAGSDLTHPSMQGADVLGDLLYKAFTAKYEAWAQGH